MKGWLNSLLHHTSHKLLFFFISFLCGIFLCGKTGLRPTVFLFYNSSVCRFNKWRSWNRSVWCRLGPWEGFFYLCALDLCPSISVNLDLKTKKQKQKRLFVHPSVGFSSKPDVTRLIWKSPFSPFCTKKVFYWDFCDHFHSRWSLFWLHSGTQR